MATSKAPTGRTIPAQGKEPRDAALGPPPPQIPSPEGTTQMPLGWVMCLIDTCCDLNPRLNKSAFEDSKVVHFVPMPAVKALVNKVDVATTRPFGEVKKGYTPFAAGDVIFAKITPCMENGKIAVVPDLQHDLAFGSTEFHVIRPFADLPPLWFFYYLSSRAYRFEAEHNMTGAVGQRRVPIDFIAQTEIPLPPLAEQRRIVAKIEELFSELDAGEESLRKARQQLGVYRQSLLKQAFEGKLTAHWRNQNPHLLESPELLLERIQAERQARYEQDLREWEDAGFGRRPTRLGLIGPLTKDENIFSGPLPTEWKAVPAEAIGDVQLGRQRSPKNQSKDYPTKYIRAANITESGLALDDILEMEFTPQERRTFTLHAGDIVLSEASGSASQVGKPAMWRGEIPSCCFQNTVIRHRLFDREQSVFYLWFYRFFYLHGVFARTAGGVGINHLSAGKFSRLPVPLCSLPEQQEIVRLLDSQFTVIEQNEREIDTALKRSAALRQSILKKAFTGQLVAQDPTDEPASALLERIQNERESASKSTQGRIIRKKSKPHG